MIAQTLRGPHHLYRRYQAFLERTATTVGLAALVTLALYRLPAYPENWVIVIGVALAAVGLRWPLLAYVGSVAVMIYPIFTVNLYLAVLFVAISALGQGLFVHYMGAMVMVLATPVLAQYHLHWLVPILAGLWWGGVTGAWIGGAAAMWGKLLGGMAGLNIDWLIMAGQTPDVQVIIERFQGANSLDTLLLLVEPFAATSSVILYNLLQVIGWATAAGLVGSLAWRKWIKYHTPWSILVLTAGGGLVMLATHLGLPYWLEEAVTEEAWAVLQDPAGPLFSLMVVIIVGTTVHSLRESLDLPVAPSGKIIRKHEESKSPGRRIVKSPLRLFRRSPRSTGREQASVEQSTSASPDRSRRPVQAPHYTELPEWEPPKDDPDLIMLEID